MNVRSNVGKEFLSPQDRAFQPSNCLHNLFTRQNVQICYKRMSSMAPVVSQNTKVLNGGREADQQPECTVRPLSSSGKVPHPLYGAWRDGTWGIQQNIDYNFFTISININNDFLKENQHQQRIV
jgi:hypothetical protein